MLRLKNLANKYQKRTCRPVYANTQATPYSATLHATDANNGFRDANGGLQVPPKKNGSAPSTFTLKGGLVPGTVLARVKGSERVTVAVGAANEIPFGLLANFVGGDLDEGFAGDSLQNEVGVWRGPDSVFEILAPAFGTVSANTGLSNSTVTAANDADVYLYAGTNGLLTTTAGTANQAVARLIEKTGDSRILVDLMV